MNSPGQNTGVGNHSLLQGIFPTQGSNSGLPYCRQILYHLSHQGSQGFYWTTREILKLNLKKKNHAALLPLSFPFPDPLFIFSPSHLHLIFLTMFFSARGITHVFWWTYVNISVFSEEFFPGPRLGDYAFSKTICTLLSLYALCWTGPWSLLYSSYLLRVCSGFLFVWINFL